MFVRRNSRLLIMAIGGVGGIFLADAVYEDMADLAYKTGQSQKIAWYLGAKWVVLLLCAWVIYYAVSRIGRGEKTEPKKEKKTFKHKSETSQSGVSNEVDARLEKFLHTRPLKRRAQKIIQKHQKR